MSSIGRGRGSSAGRAGIPRGFTLVELMVAIMVLAILLGLAVPSFRDASLGSRLAGYANDMVASSQLARSEAVKRNRLVVICATGACGRLRRRQRLILKLPQRQGRRLHRKGLAQLL
jgi:prepilin-type N-terminal cleavage/methylation domain-containing protein